MSKSILQKKKECYMCGKTQGLHDHHIYMGKNREISEAYGFKVLLCVAHHTSGDYAVHGGKYGKLLDDTLKKDCQKKFEENHSREEFVGLIGRNYLD